MALNGLNSGSLDQLALKGLTLLCGLFPIHCALEFISHRDDWHNIQLSRQRLA